MRTTKFENKGRSEHQKYAGFPIKSTNARIGDTFIERDTGMLAEKLKEKINTAAASAR